MQVMLQNQVCLLKDLTVTVYHVELWFSEFHSHLLLVEHALREQRLYHAFLHLGVSLQIT